MSRRKQFQDENIIILCEGTKTEFQYFCSIRDYLDETGTNRFSEIKIVPVENEMVTPPGHRKKKQLKAATDGLDPSICYYCLQEDTKELYDKYCANPTRYVRETKLYMERYKFKYGWAVYDHDNHPDRKAADKYAKDWGVKVIFSSRCFEEWLLIHFERCNTIFETSECKGTDGKELRCGTGKDANNCHGTKCVGGRLREGGYIYDYDKTSVLSLFRDYTLPKWEASLINTAWLNKLEVGTPIYDKTRHTDVGTLVAFLLNKNERADWKAMGEMISYRGTRLQFRESGGSIEIENTGRVSCILSDIYYRDVDCCPIIPVVEKLWLEPNKLVQFQNRPVNAAMICIRDGEKIIAIEL